MTREQRIRVSFGLPPDPPPAYVPLDLEIVPKAMRRAEVTGRKIALTSTAITAILAVPLFLLEPVAATIFILSAGPIIGAAVAKWWVRRMYQ